MTRLKNEPESNFPLVRAQVYESLFRCQRPKPENLKLSSNRPSLAFQRGSDRTCDRSLPNGQLPLRGRVSEICLPLPRGAMRNSDLFHKHSFGVVKVKRLWPLCTCHLGFSIAAIQRKSNRPAVIPLCELSRSLCGCWLLIMHFANDRPDVS